LAAHLAVLVELCCYGPAPTTLASRLDELVALPAGATVRRPMVLNAVLKTSTNDFIRVLNAYINPLPVTGAYSITVTDPTSGTLYNPTGSDVVHVDVTSFFSR
jgi:hypothetical protein